jgi:hypothetical protein
VEVVTAKAITVKTITVKPTTVQAVATVTAALAVAAAAAGAVVDVTVPPGAGQLAEGVVDLAEGEVGHLAEGVAVVVAVTTGGDAACCR